MTFAEIIHPISIEDFFENYYEKKPLHIQRNQSNYYHDFIHPSELDIHLQLNQTYSPNVKVVRNGEIVNPVYYSFEQKSVGPFIANPRLLLKEYQNGSTLKYDKLHQTYPPIAKKVSQLENELDVAIRTSVYLTPKNAKGYGLHTDRHDIFALQISGCKIWNLKFSEEILPSTYGTKINIAWDENEIQRIELKAGDLFYCPRGLSHEVFTENETSIHFTLGLQPVYGYDVVKQLGKLAYKELFFKKAIPGPFNLDENYQTNFKNELHKLIDSLSIEELFSLVNTKNELNQLHIEENLFLGEIYQPGNEDVLQVSKNWEMTTNKYACVISKNGSIHNFPINTISVFEKLKNAQQIKISDIETDLPIEHQIKFLSRLIKIKILIKSVG